MFDLYTYLSYIVIQLGLHDTCWAGRNSDGSLETPAWRKVRLKTCFC